MNTTFSGIWSVPKAKIFSRSPFGNLKTLQNGHQTRLHVHVILVTKRKTKTLYNITIKCSTQLIKIPPKKSKPKLEACVTSQGSHACNTKAARVKRQWRTKNISYNISWPHKLIKTLWLGLLLLKAGRQIGNFPYNFSS